MKKSYTVFSAHRIPVMAQATLPNGTSVTAQVDAFEAQLVPDDGASGTLKVVETDPAQFEAAEALFVVNGKVNITIEAA